jgi:hypothetical protein
MIKLIMLWTTLVCEGGVVGKTPWYGPHIYSSELYTTIEEADKVSYNWQSASYNQGRCIQFMVQKEDVTNKKILQEILGIY